MSKPYVRLESTSRVITPSPISTIDQEITKTTEALESFAKEIKKSPSKSSSGKTKELPLETKLTETIRSLKETRELIRKEWETIETAKKDLQAREKALKEDKKKISTQKKKKSPEDKSSKNSGKSVSRTQNGKKPSARHSIAFVEKPRLEENKNDVEKLIASLHPVFMQLSEIIKEYNDAIKEGKARSSGINEGVAYNTITQLLQVQKNLQTLLKDSSIEVQKFIDNVFIPLNKKLGSAIREALQANFTELERSLIDLKNIPKNLLLLIKKEYSVEVSPSVHAKSPTNSPSQNPISPYSSTNNNLKPERTLAPSRPPPNNFQTDKKLWRQTLDSPLNSSRGTMWTCNSCKVLNRSNAVLCNMCGTKREEMKRTTSSKLNIDEWKCRSCTVTNSSLETKCHMCGSAKPITTSGEWHCPSCKVVNKSTAIKCEMCGGSKPFR